MSAGRPPVHGLSHTRAYRAYRSAIQRGYDPKHQAYPHYGGRGIIMSARWRNSFARFYADMGNCPEGFTLERIDTNGDYEKSNCCWLQAEKQSANRRTCVLLTYNGKTQTIAAWAKELDILPSTISHRVRIGWSHAQALQPVMSANGK